MPLPRSSCLASQKPKDVNNRHHALLPQQTPKQSHDVFTTEPTQNNSLRCNTRIANSSSKRTPAKSKSLVAPKYPNEVKGKSVSLHSCKLISLLLKSRLYQVVKERRDIVDLKYV